MHKGMTEQDNIAQTHSVPDSEYRGFMALLPASLRPYALLARFDRPIGWWLLYWPCAAGLGFAGQVKSHWLYFLWLLLGAIVMRGAGCVYNDIVDRDLDKKVARTASRPLASGAVSLRAAWMWLVALCLIGLLVWVQLPWFAGLIAMGSLVLVAAYPFMKRVTWWPQAWLGMVFNWGALVGYAIVADSLPIAALLLYAGCIFWTIGYDTIYALQDIEDDALVGVKSSARAMGKYVQPGCLLLYTLALSLWAAAIWTARPQWLALLTLLPIGVHLLWQVATLRRDDPQDPLDKFRSNRFAGFLLFMGFATIGWVS